MPSPKTPKQSNALPPAAGLFDGNGRAARLARWLRNQPVTQTVDTLILEVKEDGEWNRLQCWERKIVDVNLASVIDEIVQDLANELGAYTHARVAWWDSEQGRTWTEHALRVQPDMQGANGEAQQVFGGDSVSIAIQNQRALERVQALYIGAIDGAVRAATMGAEDSRERARAAEEDRAQMRARLDELEQENAALRVELEEALQAAERLAAQPREATPSPAQQLLGMIGPVLQSTLAKPS